MWLTIRYARKGCVIDTTLISSDSSRSLRAHLRKATASAHNRLDLAMRRSAGWTRTADYARFLTIQYSARQPIEAWLTAHAPMDLRPPQQCPLIARDLDALGLPLPPSARGAFALPDHTDAQILGAAWTLAGSSLGNRSILKEVTHFGRGHWPVHFLDDRAMLDFWGAIRRQLDQPASPQLLAAASSGANAVFDHFLRHANATEEVARETHYHQEASAA